MKKRKENDLAQPRQAVQTPVATLLTATLLQEGEPLASAGPQWWEAKWLLSGTQGTRFERWQSKLVPHSRREMSLPGDSDPGRGFWNWGFCYFFPHHLPVVLQEVSRTVSPKSIPESGQLSLQWPTVILQDPNQHGSTDLTQLQCKEPSSLFEFLLFPHLGGWGEDHVLTPTRLLGISICI